MPCYRNKLELQYKKQNREYFMFNGMNDATQLRVHFQQ